MTTLVLAFQAIGVVYGVPHTCCTCRFGRTCASGLLGDLAARRVAAFSLYSASESLFNSCPRLLQALP